MKQLESFTSDIALNMNDIQSDDNDASWISALENAAEGGEIHISLLFDKGRNHGYGAKRQRFVGGILLVICSLLLMYIGQFVDRIDTINSQQPAYFFRFGVWLNILVGFVFNEALQLLFC